jgi:hypothetical protein
MRRILWICHPEIAHDGHKPKDNLKALKTSAPKKEFWLVVSTPLKNIKVSWDDYFPKY